MSKSRNYVFTINNYTKKSLKQFCDVAVSLSKHDYIAYGLEIAPTTGTKHIQGYIQLNTPLSYGSLHKYFNLQHRGKLVKFHCEPAKGTHKQNLKYVSKDGDFEQHGEPKQQGARTDLVDIKEKISEDPKSLNSLVRDEVTSYQQLKFAENLQKYYFKHRDVNNPPVVYWIYGGSGIGKTKIVYDTFNSICSVSDYSWLGTDYQQQDCFLLDDFRAGDISFNSLLKITDRYPYTLFFKGGSLPLNSPYIVITCPEPIETCFGIKGEDLTQLKRRVIEINLQDCPEINLLQNKL